MFVYLLVCVIPRVNPVSSHEFIFWPAVRKARQQAIYPKHWMEILSKHFHLLIVPMASFYFLTTVSVSLIIYSLCFILQNYNLLISVNPNFQTEVDVNT